MKHIKNEEAVSPVIGVILMVVITVIIAAVLAVFAFGVGTPVEVPQTKLKIETIYSNPNYNLSITNAGGDALVLKELSITVNQASGDSLIDTELMSDWNTSTYLAPGKTITGFSNKTITGTEGANITSGDIINVQIMHNPTGQSIADTRVTVH
jgi:flagellin-like protein